MIVQATLIEEPESGKYKERIYDISNPWNSVDWTWVKFMNDDLEERCGSFRGSPRGVALSERHQVVLVLTSDYLFKLDVGTGDLIAADDYHIDILHPDLQEVTSIPTPIEVDMITFTGWYGNRLSISCMEFLNVKQTLELELDSETYEIVHKDSQ